jgi:uncharacterized membrane protein YgcG
MDMQLRHGAGRSVVALVLAGGLGGCVYDPYYPSSYYPASYSPYSYYAYPYYPYPSYPYYSAYRYVGPPVSLNFGFYSHHGGGHGYGHGGHGHGGGWGHGHGGHGHGGGGGHGRH